MKHLLLLALLMPNIAYSATEYDVVGCPDISTVDTFLGENPLTGEPLIVLDLDNYRRLNEYILCVISKLREAQNAK